jgi:hypothetical protein
MLTIKNLCKLFFPQYFFTRNNIAKSNQEAIKAFLNDIKISLKKELSDPHTKAKLYGVRDYLLRRFGNCPPLIRGLGK